MYIYNCMYIIYKHNYRFRCSKKCNLHPYKHKYLIRCKGKNCINMNTNPEVISNIIDGMCNFQGTNS